MYLFYTRFDLCIGVTYMSVVNLDFSTIIKILNVSAILYFVCKIG